MATKPVYSKDEYGKGDGWGGVFSSFSINVKPWRCSQKPVKGGYPNHQPNCTSCRIFCVLAMVIYNSLINIQLKL